jgi:hypothetical protein
MDVAGIGIGTRWAEVIEDTLGSCKVAVILIGKRWLEPSTDGVRRIDQPDDPTRAEIVTALRLNLKLVPLMVSGAAVPERKDLPSEIASITDWQALRVDDDDFDHDANRLIQALENQLDDHQGSPRLDDSARKQAEIRELMDEADGAIRRSDWITAGQTLQAVLSLDRSHAEAARRLKHVQQRSREFYTPDPDPPARRGGWFSFGFGSFRMWVAVGVAMIGFVVISVGGLLNTTSLDPNVDSIGSPFPTQPPDGTNLPNDPGNSGGTQPTPAPPQSVPSQPASLAGEYELVAYQEQGVPVPLTGGLRLQELQPGRYQLQIVVTSPAYGVLQYAGFLQGDGATWITTIMQTNDARALVATPIVTQVNFDGFQLSLQNAFGQVALWRKQ